MTLYPGFEYFESKDHSIDGVVAYTNTTHAWVVGAEPLAAEADQLRLLDEFAKAAFDRRKRVLLIPADQAFAERAEQIGFRSILIGSEPTFVLDQYPKQGTDWIEVVPSAKQFASKGAIVKEFKAADLDEEKRAEMDQMTRDWLRTRKTATLGFLNQVHPWRHSEFKKYFTVELNEKVLAFLAAIPIPARNGWYLIDTIRREDSPSGTTELLLLEAMKILRSQGVQEITFGVAPLSSIELAESIPVARAAEHRILYKILRLIFEKGNQFYNFKPLFAYKMKFHPTVVRPVFLLYRGRGSNTSLSLRDIVSISQAWLPHGITHAAGLGVFKLISRLSVPDLIKAQLRPDTTVRSVPPNLMRLLYRCRLTVTLAVVSLLIFFLTTDARGFLLPEFSDQWSFTLSNLFQHTICSLVISPFLAPDVNHFVLNLLAIIIFTGGLEYLGGSTLTAICYFVPQLLATPLVALCGAILIEEVAPSLHVEASTLGGSLGVLGCAGGLFWFLRRGRTWLFILALVSGWGLLAPPRFEWSWIQLNHWVAIALGWAIGKHLLRA